MSDVYPYKNKDFLDPENPGKCAQCGYSSNAQSTRSHISRVHVKAREVPKAFESSDIFNKDFLTFSEESQESLPFPPPDSVLYQEADSFDPQTMETSPPSAKKIKLDEAPASYNFANAFNFAGAQHIDHLTVIINGRQVMTNTTDESPSIKPAVPVAPTPAVSVAPTPEVEHHESVVCPIQGFKLPDIEGIDIPAENIEEFDENDEMRLLEELFQTKLSTIRNEKLKTYLDDLKEYKKFWPDCCQSMRKLNRENQKASEGDPVKKKKDCYLFTKPFFIPSLPTLRCKLFFKTFYYFYSLFLYFSLRCGNFRDVDLCRSRNAWTARRPCFKFLGQKPCQRQRTGVQSQQVRTLHGSTRKI